MSITLESVLTISFKRTNGKQLTITEEKGAKCSASGRRSRLVHDDEISAKC